MVPVPCASTAPVPPPSYQRGGQAQASLAYRCPELGHTSASARPVSAGRAAQPAAVSAALAGRSGRGSAHLQCGEPAPDRAAAHLVAPGLPRDARLAGGLAGFGRGLRPAHHPRRTGAGAESLPDVQTRGPRRRPTLRDALRPGGVRGPAPRAHPRPRPHYRQRTAQSLAPQRPRCPARPRTGPPSYALPAWLSPPYAALSRLGLAALLSPGASQPARCALRPPPAGHRRRALPPAPASDPPRRGLLGQRPDRLDPWRPGCRRRHPLQPQGPQRPLLPAAHLDRGRTGQAHRHRALLRPSLPRLAAPAPAPGCQWPTVLAGNLVTLISLPSPSIKPVSLSCHTV